MKPILMFPISQRLCIRLCIYLFLVICLLVPLAVQAGPIDLTEFSFNGVAGDEKVSVKTNNYDGNVRVGYHELTLDATDDNWSGNYKGFCVEDKVIYQGTYTNYKLYSVNPSTPYEHAAWLMDSYYTDSAPALQLAIWEAVFDYDDNNGDNQNNFNFSSGNFQINDYDVNDKSYFGQAETYLQALYGQTSLDLTGHYTYKIASDDNDLSDDPLGKQDFIVRRPVPIPGALWLLGSGLIGIFYFNRKRTFC